MASTVRHSALREARHDMFSIINDDFCIAYTMKHYKFVLSRVLLMAYSSILLEYVLDSTYS